MRVRTRHSLVVIVACLVLAVVGQAARADLTPAGEIVLASATAGGIKANSDSFGPSLSGDGTKIAFHSMATNLDPRDADPFPDVYVKDLQTGDIVLASTADDGTKGNGYSFRPSLSADGKTVAFESIATNLDPGDTDAAVDVYVKDLITGEITLASINSDGTKGNNDSIRSSVSADGTRVAFESFATNLDPGDPDFDQDVYVKDLVTGEIILASSTDDGTKGNDGSSRPSLSADGTGVAFDSRATNLDPVDTDGCRDVYVKDMAIGEITLASLADDGTKGTCFGTIGGSSVPSLNANATKVAFESTAADLDPGDESFRSDIYVKDLTTHDITLATPTMPDVIGDQFGASISADGTRVGFGSCSLCEFVEAPFPEVFLVDVPSGDVTRASSADDGTRGNDSSVGASLSADGSRVAFQSAATNLDPADTDDVTDVYVKDLAMAVDNDEDGLSDQVEASLGTDPGLVDTDVDGINDFVESDGGSAVDTDGDGIIDALDADSDGDGILDANEGAGDTDGDGAPDYRDLDSDDDGLPDALERASGTDRLDDDSDDDGIADGEDPDTIAALIRSLPGPVFRSPSEGTRTAFLSRLELVEARIAADDAAGAISDLLDLRRRVDGCDATLSPPEAPDSNDWIRGTLADPCSAQDLVREYIDLLIANLVSGATQVSAGWGHG